MCRVRSATIALTCACLMKCKYIHHVQPSNVAHFSDSAQLNARCVLLSDHVLCAKL
jgi:hypothetical protein